MDKEQKVHEMTMDYMRTQFSKHKSPEEYVEHYQFAYAEIQRFMTQSGNLTKQ